jgi:hypothetical protein
MFCCGISELCRIQNVPMLMMLLFKLEKILTAIKFAKISNLLKGLSCKGFTHGLRFECVKAFKKILTD